MEGGTRTFELVQNCLDLNIPCVTLYGFSMENFNRHQNDISTVFDVMQYWISKLIKEQLNQHQIQFNCIGDISKLPRSLENLMRQAESISYQITNYKLKLNLALNYSKYKIFNKKTYLINIDLKVVAKM